MGNLNSCFCCPTSANVVTPKTAKLIDVYGNVKEIKVPVKAAELMLDEPGHVISPLEELRRTRHVPAMKADDELLAGNLYLLVPVGRVHSKISESEMTVVEAAAAAGGGKNKRRGRGKVLPAVIEERKGDVKVFGDAGFPGNRLGSHRQWNPVLEPIPESF
ncbi:hypothetical protein HS088_TW06G00075 [Tripterygium wilfordii]|uniref:DUF4228 domain protein n=1 Tax=Tripterygium wilfordii TaxID=458696 RepID=A0A7J7DHS0_TRIWF|nr:uncharacterized protein LOC119999708 [Tripterygium wilfordii]KAF5745910.1 hypothetical protein HS088_TW06G00075 [Tripterygium wilfordii]